MLFAANWLMRKRSNNRADPVPATSAAPVELAPKQKALFREALSALEEQHLPYAVAGGFALQQHTGISRFTKDLDIFLTPSDAAKALRLLEKRGLVCEVCDPVWLAKAHRDGYFIDLITGMSNGAITVETSWIQRAHPAVIVGVDTRVVPPEELIASKLFVVRRERFDGSDIVHIIYSLRGKLDWNRILEIAGEHWELVLWNLVLFRYAYPAHGNYIPQSLWDELLGRFAVEVRSHNLNSRFRGSLIDDKMFAIDVDDWGLENILEEHQQRRVKIRYEPRTRVARRDR